MQKSNKLNNYSGYGETFKLYLEKVYSIKPDLNNLFEDEKGTLLAKRVTLNLTQDSTYKTQFRNEELRKAIPDLTETTKFYLYDSKGSLVNSSRYGVELRPEFASIVCQSEVDIAKVSVVLYCGPGSDDILLKDGSITMDQSYIPEIPTDIATKGYVDDAIEDFVSSNYPLKAPRIRESSKGIYYKDNLNYQVLYYKESTSNFKGPSYILDIDSFAISNEFSEDTQISVYINKVPFYTEKVLDIIRGSSKFWKLEKTENIYATEVSQLYWNNSYSVTITPNSFQSLISETDPFITFYIKVEDKNYLRQSNSLTVGAEVLIKTLSSIQAEMSFYEPPEYRSVYLSGFSYYPKDESKIYDLDLKWKVENNFLNYFRPEVPFTVEILDKEGQVQSTYPVSLPGHLALYGSFNFTVPVKVNIQSERARLNFFNLDESIASKSYPLDIESAFGDESNRVTIPYAETKFPHKDYGKDWDSQKRLEVWEPKLYNGVYTVDDFYQDFSSICFKVLPEDCYSHITLDIEHNGKMYIKSEGNTGWLNCEEFFKPFTNPKEDGNPCKVNSGFYTFGKQTYKTPVFVRIVKATFIKFNYASLN